MNIMWLPLILVLVALLLLGGFLYGMFAHIAPLAILCGLGTVGVIVLFFSLLNALNTDI